MKYLKLRTVSLSIILGGTAGFMAVPAVAQDDEPDIDVGTTLSADELEALTIEAMNMEIEECGDDQECIDEVIADYEAIMDESESEAPATVEASTEDDGAGNPAPSSEGAVLNSANEADGDSGGTGGSTRPGTLPGD